MPDVWQENTQENPFWKSRVPVVVVLLDGRTALYRCPRCNAHKHKEVKRWRLLDPKPTERTYP